MGLARGGTVGLPERACPSPARTGPMGPPDRPARRAGPGGGMIRIAGHGCPAEIAPPAAWMPPSGPAALPRSGGQRAGGAPPRPHGWEATLDRRETMAAAGRHDAGGDSVRRHGCRSPAMGGPGGPRRVVRYSAPPVPPVAAWMPPSFVAEPLVFVVLH